ncbi:YncE family protein [Porphyrobacter sp. LM 6]|uniref:YncE family protein n=1 Tax=Porphyrobacter sp. LM 6 TaxID=1896196 RepID=UPI0008464051|nr:YncE family protein [Porphyrobacter sp. LM 6]AOL95074.1 YVTN family beta-propeller repeat protein [Porphyrobacter sp. LM 6]
MQTRGVIAAVAALALVASGTPALATETDNAPAALFVAGKRGNTLSKVDLTTGDEVLRVPSCVNPHELATSPDGKHVALACYGGTSVDIFTTDTLTKIRSIELGENARPHGIVWLTAIDLYVTAEGRQSIFWVRDPLRLYPETIREELSLLEFKTGKRGSHMLVVAPDTKTAWTTDLGDRTVTKIDLLGRYAPVSVAVGEEPEGISLSPDGTTLWVSARGSNQAFALDPMTLEVRQTVATGRFPLRIAVWPQGDVAITSDLQDGALSVIDTQTAKVIRTIPVSSPVEAQARFQVTILWSKDGNRIYVAETASDTVAEVDFASGVVLRRFNAGEGGDGMAILP